MNKNLPISKGAIKRAFRFLFFTVSHVSHLFLTSIMCAKHSSFESNMSWHMTHSNVVLSLQRCFCALCSWRHSREEKDSAHSEQGKAVPTWDDITTEELLGVEGRARTSEEGVVGATLDPGVDEVETMLLFCHTLTRYIFTLSLLLALLCLLVRLF